LAVLDDLNIRTCTRNTRARFGKRTNQSQQCWAHETLVYIQITDYLGLLAFHHGASTRREGLLGQVTPE
jgi:hypothetical protein